ncbi:hypothetical protein [Polyangium jinanense]|uniref:Uncharacterized protein n=1 Tax=Polyangium jinanense TaxID=2829994 RepID=A0A9X4AUB5_9BACT|nr:hypothetical protein [Polyangium jinanense]MDC3958615.1 hypothetical protein [Polyangium jinanense]MDC3983077.1 hypothetical protein [Polyangium jinanense]
MKNIIGYHNTEKMGYSLIDGKGPFTFYTRKPVQHLLGARVWAIAGEGQPRRYFLGGWFIVNEARPTDRDEFTNLVRGTEGKTFKPMIRLDQHAWFADFRKSQSNFSLGLLAAKDEFVRHLEALAAQATATKGRG